MMPFAPRDLSREQARRHLARAEETLDFRLTELARWMASSDGPIDEMDASLASVRALWEWTRTFTKSSAVGIIPEEWRTDYSLGFESAPELQYRRSLYVAQAWQSYIFRILQRLDPSTRIDLYRWAGADHYYYNDLVYRSDSKSDLAPSLRHLQICVADGVNRPERVDLTKFMAWFSTQFAEWIELAGDDPRGPSILAPLVERPLSDFDSLRNPPEFVSEPRVAPDKSAPALAQLEEDEFMIAPRDYNPDDLAAGQALDSEIVHQALLEMDASLGGGGTITPPTEWLAQDETDLGLGSVASVTIFVANGEVRGIGVEIGEVTKKEWRTLSKQMRALAKKMKAHFAPAQDESWAANI